MESHEKTGSGEEPASPKRWSSVGLPSKVTSSPSMTAAATTENDVVADGANSSPPGQVNRHEVGTQSSDGDGNSDDGSSSSSQEEDDETEPLLLQRIEEMENQMKRQTLEIKALRKDLFKMKKEDAKKKTRSNKKKNVSTAKGTDDKGEDKLHRTEPESAMNGNIIGVFGGTSDSEDIDAATGSEDDSSFDGSSSSRSSSQSTSSAKGNTGMAHKYDGQVQFHPKDTYSFIICSKVQGTAFWFGLFVATVQVLLFSLLVVNRIDGGGSGSGTSNNPFNLPANVEPTVRVTQIAVIAIAVFVQDDLRISLERILEGYVDLNPFPDKNFFPYANRSKWCLSYTLRLLQGSFGLFVMFMLIVQSDEIFELLLNFTGIAFVSELDDLAFLLSSRQFFGKTMQTESANITRNVYRIKQPDSSSVSQVGAISGGSGSMIMCGRGLFLLLVTALMYVGFAIIWRDQSNGKYLCRHIYVEFSDVVIPSLGIHSGFYELDDERRYHGRIVYQEMRRGGERDDKRYQGMIGRLGYCQEDNVWTFAANQAGSDHDPCDDNGDVLAKSSETDTFDVLETSNRPWYSSRAGLPLDLVQISCPSFQILDCDNGGSADGNSLLFPTLLDGNPIRDGGGGGPCRIACERLMVATSGSTLTTTDALDGLSFEGAIDSRIWSRYFNILTESSAAITSELNQNDVVIQAYDHPIYYGRNIIMGGSSSSSEDQRAIDLVFFTGRRWAWTDSSKIRGIGNATDLKSVVEYFQEENFHASKLLVNENGNNITTVSGGDSLRPISYLSEAVSAGNDPLSPIGLRWYVAHYTLSGNTDFAISAKEGGPDESGSDQTRSFSFPSADSTRPTDASFSCTVCNDESNPCLYEGECDSVTGICTCKHGARGDLCDDAPLGNGLCDVYFNSPFHDYDGGDCCGATCEGPACDEPLMDSQLDNCESSTARGFPNCVDPNMVDVTMIIDAVSISATIDVLCVPGGGRADSVESDDDEIRYYTARPECAIIPNRLNETIQVRDGSNCKVSFGNLGLTQLIIDDIYILFEYNSGGGRRVAAAATTPTLNYYIDTLGDERIQKEFAWLLDEWKYDVEFYVPSECLLLGIIDHIDLGWMSYPNATQTLAIKSLEATAVLPRKNEQTASVCDTNLEQQYAIEFMSYSGWFDLDQEFCQQPELRCDVNRNVISVLASVGDETSFFFNSLGPGFSKVYFVSEIGLLKSLSELKLDKYQFIGSIPTELGNLENLESLMINSRYNVGDFEGLAGDIPLQVYQLSKLTSLDIGTSWYITGQIPTDIANLQKLESLVLYQLSLSGTIPSEIGSMSALESLRLQYNELTGIIPTEIGNLSSLNVLMLDSNGFVGSLPTELLKLTILEELTLCDNGLDGSIPTDVGVLLTSLTRFSLCNNNFVGTIPPSFDHLTDLTFLSLEGNNLTGSIPTFFGDLTLLSDLYLSLNNLTGSIPTSFGELTHLSMLYVGDNHLRGSLPSILGRLTNLIHLRAAYNGITGSLPTELGSLSGLYSLFLGYNKLSGTVSSEMLRQFSQITWLSLQSNEFSGQIPSEFGLLTTLKSMDLSSNKFTGLIPSELGLLTSLTYLNLGGNNLDKNVFGNTQVPEELQNLCYNTSSDAEIKCLFDRIIYECDLDNVSNDNNLTGAELAWQNLIRTTKVELRIQFDDSPMEIGYTLVRKLSSDGDGSGGTPLDEQVIATVPSGTFINNQAGQHHVETFDLSRGRYALEITDTAENGICCEFGEGHVEIYALFDGNSGGSDDSDNYLIGFNDGVFGANVTIPFNVC